MATEPQPVKPSILLSDGTLEFVVRRKEGESRVNIDLLCLKLCCEDCEDRHQLQRRNGLVNPTPAFLQDLATQLVGIGVDACTPSLAWQLWRAAAEQMEELKKSTSETPSLPSGSELTPAHSPPSSGLDGSLTLSE